MLKVLIIGPSISRTKGGMATVIGDLLKNNNQNGSFEFIHVVSHVEGAFVEKLQVSFRALLQVLFYASFDIIHVHVASDISIFRKSLFIYLGLLRNKPVVVHVHGGDFDVYYHKSSSLVKYFIKKTFAKCQKILVLSEYWKSFFKEHISQDKVEVLHNGVDGDTFKNCCSIPLHLSNFLFMGRLSQPKGVYDLLQAADRLVNQQQQRHLQFFLAGNGDKEQVESIIRQTGLSANVHLLGWLDDEEKREWLQQVDTVVLPSYIEGLPMCLIEAMAAGKVIISSRIGGIPDLVKEENGFLIEPGDIDGLCEYILYVSTHAEHMIAISDKNMATVGEQYQLTNINRQLHDIYFQLAKLQIPHEKVSCGVYSMHSQREGQGA